MATTNSPWVTLHVERDQIEVTSNLPQPDPKWTQVDASGHLHAYMAHLPQFKGNPYPTLLWVVDMPGYMGADGEEYPEDGHYECNQCGEHIAPGTFIDSERRFIPGPVSYTLEVEMENGERVTAALSKESADEVRTAQLTTARRVVERIRAGEAEGVITSISNLIELGVDGSRGPHHETGCVV